MISDNVLRWLSSHHTGRSSLAIVAWMERDLAILALQGIALPHPLDPSDLGRCIRLLDIEPRYRTRLGEMAGVSPQWERLVARWNDLEALYREEQPSGRAPKCYELMHQLIAEPADATVRAARASKVG